MIFAVIGKYTPQAVANLIANPTDREAVARQAVQSVGGTLINWFANPGGDGSWSILAIYDVPEATSHFAAYSAVLATGAFTELKSMRLLTSEEFQQGLSKAKGMEYQSPLSSGA